MQPEEILGRKTVVFANVAGKFRRHDCCVLFRSLGRNKVTIEEQELLIGVLENEYSYNPKEILTITEVK